MGLNTFNANGTVFERIEISGCDKNYWVTTPNSLDAHNITIRDCTGDSSRAENFYHEAGTKCTFDNIRLTNSGTKGFSATIFGATDSTQTTMINVTVDTCERGFISIGSDNIFTNIRVYNDTQTANESVQINGNRNNGNFDIANVSGHGARIYGHHNDIYTRGFNIGTHTDNTYDGVLVDGATYCKVAGDFSGTNSNKMRYGINEINSADYNILGDAIGENTGTATVHKTGTHSVASANNI